MQDVATITYRPTELIGENTSEKRVIFDIYCVTDTNQHFIEVCLRIAGFQNSIIWKRKQYKKSILDYYDVRDAVNVAREDGIKIGYNSGLKS